MKLTPTKFYAAFKDGLLEMTGHSFEAIDRTFVVHRPREPFCQWSKDYLVSDYETGFKIPILPTRSRITAAYLAVEALNQQSPRQLAQMFAMAAIARAKLKIINQA